MMRGRSSAKARETLPYGLALWIVPALPIALSAKYQQQLHFGLGYLPVFLEYFGAGIVLATVLTKVSGTRAHVLALGLTVAAFPAVALATFASNREVAIDASGPYLASRDVFGSHL
jgi:hypothetical protein